MRFHFSPENFELKKGPSYASLVHRQSIGSKKDQDVKDDVQSWDVQQVQSC
jgi:hypothetical protein